MFFSSKLSKTQKIQISKAIHEAELGTVGEIRVHLSYSKKETDLLKAAEARFQTLKMHESRHRNGILLYVNPSVKQFSLFGDQGIHEKVGQSFWNELAESVSKAIREKNPHQGIIHAVENLGLALKKHFPSDRAAQNELSDEVTESE